MEIETIVKNIDTPREDSWTQVLHQWSNGEDQRESCNDFHGDNLTVRVVCQYYNFHGRY